MTTRRGGICATVSGTASTDAVTMAGATYHDETAWPSSGGVMAGPSSGDATLVAITMVDAIATAAMAKLEGSVAANPHCRLCDTCPCR